MIYVFPILCCFRAFIAGTAVGNTVRVFKLGKRDDGTTTGTQLGEDFQDAYNK